ncbi:hypothetical protein HanRHA438_Chr01g0035271 [Helianthus annuus]|nr:hypothetical protein HanRHA438_Chr01g0035271 [Helianthus annuus]
MLGSLTSERHAIRFSSIYSQTGQTKIDKGGFVLNGSNRLKVAQNLVLIHVIAVDKRLLDAPEYWRNLDPYWTGAEDAPMHRYFHPDGSQTADSSDQVWGGHESCYSIITSFLADGTIREHYVRINRWPQLHISRREDWGWEMSNRLYCYSSVPDAHLKGGTGPSLPIL